MAAGPRVSASLDQDQHQCGQCSLIVVTANSVVAEVQSHVWPRDYIVVDLVTSARNANNFRWLLEIEATDARQACAETHSATRAAEAAPERNAI
jgi:hypothetical protein